ncbi:PROTEIN KINASE SUPERFAMILY PROTEIN [Salix purpurea]|uniref:PROTEIN KINASE SUPERFAMILY PROTEIN n=1 Tax=Salix purpurea TaxID=77065 RepID=A0A9Q0SPQ0_SALPP|nr:PROTEIN KINASE SUPERFAMILY PROTEIN [Salix purpurea]
MPGWSKPDIGPFTNQNVKLKPDIGPFKNQNAKLKPDIGPFTNQNAKLKPDIGPFTNQNAKLNPSTAWKKPCRSNPIRNFSADQICKAIEDYREIHHIQIQIDFQWKRGVLDGRLVFIKVYASGGQEVYRDIVVSSQMSSHNNVLKLLGCCLEIPEGPALVYEYAENWPIIHRDIKPENIFLNKNQAAKLVDFSCSISIPEGKSKAGDGHLVGTCGFLDPEYLTTNFVTEKTDVFSFGVLLLVLLTGRAALQGEIHLIEYVDRVNEAVDPMIRGNGGEATDQQQLEAAIELALRCTTDEKYAHLKKLDKATENLKLFKADLLDYNSLCSAAEGCRGVFLRIEPAVEGTLNVLKACAEAKGGIIVSSGSAVARNSNWDRVMDETMCICDDFKMKYC